MEIFTCYSWKKDKDYGSSFSCNDPFLLSTMTGISYKRVKEIFIDEKRHYVEFPEEKLIIIYSKILHKLGKKIKVNSTGTTYNRNL